MSFQAFAWAVTAHPGSAAEKLVLLGLADRHNTEHNYAYPSTVWLTEFSGLDRKTVIVALDRLETAGLIRDTRLRVGKTRQIKVYSLVMESAEKAEVAMIDEAKQGLCKNSPKIGSLPSKAPVFPGKGSQKREADTIKEPVSSEPKGSSPRAWALPVGVSLQVWQDFLTNRKRKRLPNTDTSWKTFLDDLTRVSLQTGIPPPKLIEVCTGKGWGSINDPERKPSHDRPSNPTALAVQRVASGGAW